jgi:alpha-N-arabinofuranosidase
MYIPFQDATFVPIELGKVPEYSVDDLSVPQLSVSAALTRDGQLVMALVNLHARDGIEVSTNLDGFAARKAIGSVLTGNTTDAHNSFDKPDIVVPAVLAVQLEGDLMTVSLPPRSLAVIRLTH